MTIITDSAMKADLFQRRFVAEAGARERLIVGQKLEALSADRDMNVTMTPGFAAILKRTDEDLGVI